MLAAVIPFLLGMLVGNINPQWREILRPTPAIVIPFFALALGTGIDLNNIVKGGPRGLVVGLVVAPVTGLLTYLGYRFLLRRGYRSGIGFAAGTTAGNAIATPAIIGLADPRFQPYVETATAQVAASVLVTAILAAAARLRRAEEAGRPPHRGGDRAHRRPRARHQGAAAVKVLVLADDLTGAADTVVSFARSGGPPCSRCAAGGARRRSRRRSPLTLDTRRDPRAADVTARAVADLAARRLPQDRLRPSGGGSPSR